jgi:predicted transcriptional regulator
MHGEMKSMRTTVEIKDEHRSKLLQYAARRGEKGFSRIVGEALDLYFERQKDRQEKVRRALGALGSLSEADARDLRDEANRLRDSWR